MYELEKNLDYTFKNKDLLKQALTHSSYANEAHTQSNERLEFLGDSVLSLVVSDHIYTRFNTPEGELTKLRASLVCEASLYEFAKELELGKFMLLGKGEQQYRGNERPSMLADAFEAVLAAIYLDGGMEPAKKLVLRFVKEDLIHTERITFKDYKTKLQEVIQKNPEEHLEYVLVDEKGPDHAKEFTVELRLNSNVIAQGIGKSKKSAEQNAACEALKLMGL
ncbi:MAG: ribonuclease III [Acutalibacteraceae bacterium]|nr:ribonuclease III [Acutalibacteraceae bacterium]